MIAIWLLVLFFIVMMLCYRKQKMVEQLDLEDIWSGAKALYNALPGEKISDWKSTPHHQASSLPSSLGGVPVPDYLKNLWLHGRDSVTNAAGQAVDTAGNVLSNIGQGNLSGAASDFGSGIKNIFGSDSTAGQQKTPTLSWGDAASEIGKGNYGKVLGISESDPNASFWNAFKSPSSTSPSSTSPSSTSPSSTTSYKSQQPQQIYGGSQQPSSSQQSSMFGNLFGGGSQQPSSSQQSSMFGNLFGGGSQQPSSSQQSSMFGNLFGGGQQGSQGSTISFGGQQFPQQTQSSQGSTISFGGQQFPQSSQSSQGSSSRQTISFGGQTQPSSFSFGGQQFPQSSQSSQGSSQRQSISFGGQTQPSSFSFGGQQFPQSSQSSQSSQGSSSRQSISFGGQTQPSSFSFGSFQQPQQSSQTISTSANINPSSSANFGGLYSNQSMQQLCQPYCQK